MAHYLVTGAAGFIASRTTELLLADGHTVTGVDNLNDAYDIRLKQWRLARLEAAPRFTFCEADVQDRAAMESVWNHSAPFDAVVNLAARAGVRQSAENPWIYVDTNMTGTLNLLELCRQRGVPKFLLASTSSLYGSHNTMPYSENADTNMPLSPYAATKKAAESMCHSYHHLYGIDVSVVRYFTVYGPAGRPDMSVFRFVQWVSEGRPVTLFGDGSQSRDFTYVDDIARGTIAALRPLGYETINLGSDRPVQLLDVLKTVEQLVGRPAQVTFRDAHPADVPATWADISRARDLLDWSPQVPYQRGLECAVKWYNENHDWARDIHTH